jgi:hypothetical protein
MVAGLAMTAQESPAPRLVFDGGNDWGEVWANVGLIRHRVDEDYLPMVVAILNRCDRPVRVDRDSIRLIGRDGRRYPMPTLKELRADYDRFAMDARQVSGAGIPWQVWQSQGRLVEVNFFPDIGSDRRALLLDEVTLGTGYAMVDLLYFAKPVGFAAGEPVILEVEAAGWEAPVRLGIVFE